VKLTTILDKFAMWLGTSALRLTYGCTCRLAGNASVRTEPPDRSKVAVKILSPMKVASRTQESSDLVVTLPMPQHAQEIEFVDTRKSSCCANR
jgi:hypothetical protein